jgi:3,2-trans-enoyl-CoA isomerase
LATCCDYRVMVASDKFTIGLNEAKFGLVAPFWLMDTFKLVVGQREAELGLQLGKLYSVEEAKQIGLIDEIVDSKEAAVTECARMISEMNKCVPLARHLTKMSMRERTIQRMIAGRAKDIDTVVSVVLQEPMQKAVSAYISSLSGGKSKGKQH